MVKDHTLVGLLNYTSLLNSIYLFVKTLQMDLGDEGACHKIYQLIDKIYQCIE